MTSATKKQNRKLSNF